MITRSIGSRELIRLGRSGASVHATYHRASPTSYSQDDARETAGSRIGILFVNALSVPRSSPGDVAVRWSDALANLGFPCFRMDLPGIGDSFGTIEEKYIDHINSGGYTSILSATTRELVESFGLAGVVIVGICAGAVNAIYAASAAEECKGLILIHPYFNVPNVMAPRVRPSLTKWLRHTRTGTFCRGLYNFFNEGGYLPFTRTLPCNANDRLVQKCIMVASKLTPILVINSLDHDGTSQTPPKRRKFDYLCYIADSAGTRARITVKTINGADHSFASSIACEVGIQHIARWLLEFFGEMPSMESVEIKTKQTQPTFKSTPLIVLEEHLYVQQRGAS